MKPSTLRFENLESRIVLDGLGLGGPPELIVASVIPPSDNAGRDVQVVIPAHAQQLAPGVFSLGQAVDPATGKTVDGLAFLQYRKSFGHNPNSPPNHGGGGGGNGGGGGGGEECFEVLAKGAKWKTVEDYIVDPDNIDDLSDGDVYAAIDAAIDTWNAEVVGDIFGDRIGGVVDGADSVAPDNKNEVLFGDIADAGAVAVTITWGIFRGPPSGRELVEWDQVYDHTDFDFGDAAADSSLMDLQGVGAHEVGHAGGLGHPSDTCTEETMYAFVTNGEIKKRDLNAGDIAGIQSLYGAANAATASQVSSGIGVAIESVSDGKPFDTLPEDAPPVGETPSGPPSLEQLPEDAPPVEALPQFAPPHSNENALDLVMSKGKSIHTLDELVELLS